MKGDFLFTRIHRVNTLCFVCALLQYICNSITMGLLKGLNPILTADLLYVLRNMGHGDSLCICDCNFPAASISQQTTSKAHIILTVSLPEALEAITSLLPLDHFVECPATHMAPQGNMEMPPAGIEVIDEAKKIVREASDIDIMPVERFEFYEESKKCYAIVQTIERRPYANVILTKGVIGPDGKDLKP